MFIEKLEYVYCSEAVQEKDFDQLKSMIMLGCPWAKPKDGVSSNTDFLCSEKCIEDKPYSYNPELNIEMFKYCVLNGCSVSENIFVLLANQGDLQTLKWVLENVKVFDEKNVEELVFSDQVFRNAIYSQSQEMMDFVLKRGCVLNSSCIKAAILTENLPMLHFLLDTKHFVPSRSDCVAAVQAGNLDILKLLRHTYNCEWDSSVLETAIEYSELSIVQYAFAEGLNLPRLMYSNYLEMAVKAGNCYIIDLLYTNKPQNVSLEIQERMRANERDIYVYDNLNLNCIESSYDTFINDSIAFLAIEENHLDVLEWAYTKGILKPKCDQNQEDNMLTSLLKLTQSDNINYGEWNMLNLTIKQNCKWCKLAAKNGFLPILKWLRSKGFCWDKNKMCGYALEGNNLQLLQYLLSQGCELNLRKAMNCLSSNFWCRSLEIFFFVLSYFPTIEEKNKAIRDYKVDLSSWFRKKIDLDKYREFMDLDVSHIHELQQIKNEKKMEIYNLTKACELYLCETASPSLHRDLIKYCIVPYI